MRSTEQKMFSKKEKKPHPIHPPPIFLALRNSAALSSSNISSTFPRPFTSKILRPNLAADDQRARVFCFFGILWSFQIASWKKGLQNFALFVGSALLGNSCSLLLWLMLLRKLSMLEETYTTATAAIVVEQLPTGSCRRDEDTRHC